MRGNTEGGWRGERDNMWEGGRFVISIVRLALALVEIRLLSIAEFGAAADRGQCGLSGLLIRSAGETA